MVGGYEVDIDGLLVKELENVAKLMKEEPDLRKKLYYFTAAFGIADRTVRVRYDRELALVVQVLQNTYNQFMARFTAIGQGDRVIPLDAKMIDDLADLTEYLAKSILKDQKETYYLLQKFNELAYYTTGPGYYVYLVNKKAT